MTGELCAWLIANVDHTYRTGNWAGIGVLKTIEGISPEVAGWRPHPDQPSIAEIILHMAYWKDCITAKLLNEPWTYDEAVDFRTLPATEEGWTEAKAELEFAHLRLMEALRTLDPRTLLDAIGKKWWSESEPLQSIDHITGIAHHDMYHVGQIVTIQRMAPGASG